MFESLLERLRRFKEREKVGHKRYKITEEDRRNRRKGNPYAKAVHTTWSSGQAQKTRPGP